MMKTSKVIKDFGIRTIAGYAFVICAVFILSVYSAKAATFTVSSTNDAGPGSLRQAILDANINAGADTITISVAAFSTITPLSPLPQITDTVNIGSGTRVTLNGSMAGATAYGLRVSAPNCFVQGFIINSFQEGGIRIDGTANNTSLDGLHIGVNFAGDTAVPNTNRGVLIVGTTGNLIGGFGLANVISGNLGRGIEITAGGSATIRGNRIGTSEDGTVDLGNTSHGIQIVNSSGSIVGGTTAGQRNIISGNDGSGVFIVGDINTPASNNLVIGNYIGVDVSGNTELNNNGSGVAIQDRNNTVGGTTVGARNVISGNSVNGVTISTTLATGNTVAGNYIGVGANGTTSIPNVNDGVRISSQAANNTIGGVGVTPGMCNNSCNLIANNGVLTAVSARSGVYVDPTSGMGNRLRGNSIFNNFGIGIDLHTSGSTANDANDPDSGANNIQNFPVLTAADTNGTVTGTLNSSPNALFAIDFYSNTAADGPNSEGRTFIGSTTVITDAGGNAPFNFGTTATLAAGQFITSTATTTGGAAQAIGDTSEFSATQAVAPGTGGATGLESDISPRMTGDGNILSDDAVQIRRFFNGTDTPNTTPNEFQRADSSPIATRGDGRILSDDVVQTRRYQNSSDTRQSAGGPTVPSGGLPSLISDFYKLGDESNLFERKGREVRVENASGNTGETVTVNIRVSAVDEAEYGLILNYDASVLSNPVVGAGNAGASVRACNIANLGQISCSIGGFPKDQAGSSDAAIGEIGAGDNQILITVTFRIATKAQLGKTSLTLSNVNASTDAPKLIIPAATNGIVTIQQRRNRK